MAADVPVLSIAVTEAWRGNGVGRMLSRGPHSDTMICDLDSLREPAIGRSRYAVLIAVTDRAVNALSCIVAR